MKIEHFAFNVEDPRGMADWLIEHFEMKLVSQLKEKPYLTFLADSTKQVMIEIYRDPEDEVPDYWNQDPLIIHLAFVSEDAGKDKERLLEAGATLYAENITDDGSHMVMIRDPWGFPIQIWQRTTPKI